MCPGHQVVSVGLGTNQTSLGGSQPVKHTHPRGIRQARGLSGPGSETNGGRGQGGPELVAGVDSGD